MTARVERVGEAIGIAREGGLATVTLDRGDGRNALSRQILLDFKAAALSFADDLETRAIVLTGTPVFSAGADLKDPSLARRADAGLLERRLLLRAGPEMCDAWAAVRQPVVAAIEGYAIGGGVALVSACDFRIAGEGAFLRLPEIPLGMNMSWHTVPRLVSLMGPARAKAFVMLGEKLEAPIARAEGLLDAVVPDGTAFDVAMDLAARLAALPPNAVQMTKSAVDAAAGALHQASTFMDLDQFALTATSEDAKEAIAAFLDKRQPRFTGR
ncbi:MAG: enoyl-CoA hydratase/isomerase family protein [Alphaproteobacteria bacterium]|nr:enoyl-CoA hydratase/isomerase family protein [Alphaproteobacteria bacterium]